MKRYIKCNNDQKETIKVELTANIEINSLSDEEYQKFVESGELPEYVFSAIKSQFFSNIINGYAWVDDEQNTISRYSVF